MTDVQLPVLEMLAQMNENTLERSRLDARTFMLLRIAALASVGAAPASYAVNFGAADESGLEPEMVQGALVAIAPIVGSARIAEAAIAMGSALGVEIPVDGLAG